MYNHTFGHDVLGRYLDNKLQGAKDWALENFTKADADLDEALVEARKAYRLSLPTIIRESLWVEYKPVGNGRSNLHSEPDRIAIHVPLLGTAELVNHVGTEGSLNRPRVQGDELVVHENRQLTYFPEKALDPAAARKAGEAFKARALQVAEGCVAEVERRSVEIDHYNTAVEAALQEQRARVENARRYRAELEAGIGLPTSRPSVDGGDGASR